MSGGRSTFASELNGLIPCYRPGVKSVSRAEDLSMMLSKISLNKLVEVGRLEGNEAKLIGKQMEEKQPL